VDPDIDPWKACWVQALRGSNPLSSATLNSNNAGNPTQGGPAFCRLVPSSHRYRRSRARTWASGGRAEPTTCRSRSTSFHRRPSTSPWRRPSASAIAHRALLRSLLAASRDQERLDSLHRVRLYLQLVGTRRLGQRGRVPVDTPTALRLAERGPNGSGVPGATDPEYQEKLHWVEEFMREKVEPLDFLLTFRTSRAGYLVDYGCCV